MLIGSGWQALSAYVGVGPAPGVATMPRSTRSRSRDVRAMVQTTDHSVPVGRAGRTRSAPSTPGGQDSSAVDSSSGSLLDHGRRHAGLVVLSNAHPTWTTLGSRKSGEPFAPLGTTNKVWMGAISIVGPRGSPRGCGLRRHGRPASTCASAITVRGGSSAVPCGRCRTRFSPSPRPSRRHRCSG